MANLDATVEDEGVDERNVVGAAGLQRLAVGQQQVLVQARQEGRRPAAAQVHVHLGPARNRGSPALGEGRALGAHA